MGTFCSLTHTSPLKIVSCTLQMVLETFKRKKKQNQFFLLSNIIANVNLVALPISTQNKAHWQLCANCFC